MKKHFEKCLYITVDDEMEQYKQRVAQEVELEKQCFREQLIKKEMEIQRLSARLEIMEERLKTADEIVTKCIDRPTTSTTNNVNSNNHHVNNILVDGKTFAEHTDPRRIEEIARKNMEPRTGRCGKVFV